MIDSIGIPSATLARLTGKPIRRPGTRNAYVTYQDSYTYGGVTFSINQGRGRTGKPGGVYTDILRKAIEVSGGMVEVHGRVLAVVFELHGKCISGSNKLVSDFVSRVRRRLELRYQTYDIGHLWVRELERAKAAHYHIVLFLDGDKVRHSAKIREEAEDVWRRMAGSATGVNWSGKPYRFVDSQQDFVDLIEHLSYFAKVRGKGYGEQGARNFGSSRSRLTIPLESSMRRLRDDDLGGVIRVATW